jgi:transcriptional regulator with XRE-family HTH domain
MNAGTALRTVRADAGWSQRELARRSGIAQPSISDIESGDRDTTVAKLGQILKAADYALIAIPSSRPTVADWAVRLASLLRQDPGAIEKSLVQIADDLAAVDGATRVALCVTPPAPTKSPAIDAVLAGLVELVLSRDGLPTPEWVFESDRSYGDGWDLVAVPGLRDAARATTPDPFRRRNVFIPADFFASS